MSYTTIQVKRTNNKTLDDSSLANIVPAYGEIVFSHTSGKDEFVIGDNSTTIPNLPRLNMQAASNMSKFDGNKLTLGDNTHQGSIELYDGSNNKTTVVPSSTSDNITVTLPNVSGTLVTTNNVPDEKVTIENNTSSSNTPVYPTYYTSTSGNSVKLQADDGYKVITRNGTTSSLGASFLYLGNDKASGTSGNKTGGLYIYSRGTNPIVVQPVDNVTRQRAVSLPDADGVIALVGGDLGAATASTPAAGDSSTKVATTEFVTNAISGSSTDEKLAINLNTSGTSYYPIVGTGTTASIRQYDTNFTYTGTKGTTTTVGTSVLTLGNNIGSGTADNERGQLVLYGNNTHKVTIQSNNPTSDIAVTLPNSAGTLATTDDIVNNRKVVLPTSAPSDNIKGQLYIDPTTSILYYNSANTGQTAVWKPIVGVWG